MNLAEFKIANSDVWLSLESFCGLQILYKEVIVLGSVALISYTSAIGYYRKIKDIDTIVDSEYKDAIESKLKSRGYKKSTFIDPRMPFALLLRRYAESKYVRFHKSGFADLEILFTPFVQSPSRIQIELFPHIYASMPKTELVQGSLEGNTFGSVTPEILMAIKQLAHNTVGRIYTRGREKRFADHEALRKIIDREKYDRLYKELTIKIFGLGIPLSARWFNLA